MDHCCCEANNGIALTVAARSTRLPARPGLRSIQTTKGRCNSIASNSGPFAILSKLNRFLERKAALRLRCALSACARYWGSAARSLSEESRHEHPPHLEQPCPTTVDLI